MSTSIVVLVGRILLAIMFITSGFGKLMDPGMTAGMIAGAGFPAAMALAYIAGLFELIAGLAVLVGFQTKIAGYLLALFCLFTAFVFHGGPFPIAPAKEMLDIAALPNKDALEGYFGFLGTLIGQLLFWKNITLAGGFLVLAGFGAGPLSIDGRRSA